MEVKKTLKPRGSVNYEKLVASIKEYLNTPKKSKS